MLKRLMIIPAAILLVLIVLPGQADVTLKYRSGADGEPNTVMVSGAMVRTDSNAAKGSSTSLYDDRNKSLTIINKQKKSYLVMDNGTIKEQVGRMQAAQKQMMAQMQEKLQGLPEDQRRQVEKQLAQMGMGNPGAQQPVPKFSSKKTNRSESVNGINCNIYESYKDDDKIGEACIADPAALKLSKSDYQTLQGMFSFLRSMTKQFSFNSPGTKSEIGMFDDVEGLPIKVTNAQGSVMSLLDISNQALSSDLFKVPDGYQQAEMSAPDDSGSVHK
jgi:hypothetical protein